MLTAVFLLIALIGWYVWDIVRTGEYYITRRPTIQKIAAFLRTSGREKNIVYDLGSGRGDFLIRLMRECPGLHGTGFEKSLLKVWISRIRAFFRGSKAKFLQKDFLTLDTSRADVVYAYLPRPLLPALAEKLKRELKPGAIAITSRVELPGWNPKEIIAPAKNEERIFVYERTS